MKSFFFFLNYDMKIKIGVLYHTHKFCQQKVPVNNMQTDIQVVSMSAI